MDLLLALIERRSGGGKHDARELQIHQGGKGEDWLLAPLAKGQGKREGAAREESDKTGGQAHTKGRSSGGGRDPSRVEEEATWLAATEEMKGKRGEGTARQLRAVRIS